MPNYHNNELTTIGLDSSDDDVKPHTPSRSPKAPKRKRATKNKMSEKKALPGDSHGNGYVEDGYDDEPFDCELPSTAPTFGGNDVPSTDAYNSNDDMFTHGLPISEAYPVVGGSFYQGNTPFLSMFSASSEVDSQPFSSHTYNHFAGGEYDRQDAELDSLTSGQDQQTTDVRCQAEAEAINQAVSYNPPVKDEEEDNNYEERRPSKIPKQNKDGQPRKPRQPRAKLLKWDDNDWKNVALGLVWACGENGIQIPFDQASQVVSESCTAGALQQALLKLRGKQISEGFQIPNLRMAWTRKNKKLVSDTSRADSIKPQESTGTIKNTLPKKKPTRVVGLQAGVVTLKRAYIDAHRAHLARPHHLEAARSVLLSSNPTLNLIMPDHLAGAGSTLGPISALNGNAYGGPSSFDLNGVAMLRTFPAQNVQHPRYITDSGPLQHQRAARSYHNAQGNGHGNVPGFTFGGQPTAQAPTQVPTQDSTNGLTYAAQTAIQAQDNGNGMTGFTFSAQSHTQGQGNGMPGLAYAAPIATQAQDNGNDMTGPAFDAQNAAQSDGYGTVANFEFGGQTATSGPAPDTTGASTSPSSAAFPAQPYAGAPPSSPSRKCPSAPRGNGRRFHSHKRSSSSFTTPKLVDPSERSNCSYDYTPEMLSISELGGMDEDQEVDDYCSPSSMTQFMLPKRDGDGDDYKGGFGNGGSDSGGFGFSGFGYPGGFYNGHGSNMAC